MKIQLQSLRVINCGPLRDVCIHFATDGDSPVTVLAGANGSGKTTVLELIVALCEFAYPDEQTRVWPPILNRTEYARLEMLIDGERVALYHGKKHPETVPRGNYLKRTPTGHQYEMTSHVLSNFTTALKAQQAVLDKVREKEAVDDTGFLSRLLPEGDDIVPSLCYFPYMRFLPSLKAEQIHKEQTGHDWVYRYETPRSSQGSLDSYLIWLDYAEPKVFDKVIAFLNALNFDGKKFGVSRRDLKATVTTSDGATHYSEQLSSGEQNILIMLLELRRRLLPHSIVLIDEIENSLHPAFQHRIVNGLKQLQEETPFQLIVTSHSLTILEAFGTQSARILTQF
jgi:ABC-type lipoprotein export system ATPase subunit